MLLSQGPIRESGLLLQMARKLYLGPPLLKAVGNKGWGTTVTGKHKPQAHPSTRAWKLALGARF